MYGKQEDSYIRICKKCNGEIKYKSKKAFILANNKGTYCFKCTCIRLHSDKTKFNINFLLEDKLTSAYYLGLIIADGWLNGNTFELTLKERDALDIFPELVDLCGGCPIYNKKIKGKNYSKIGFNNKLSVGKVVNKFKIHKIKTYNPISFDVFKKYTKEYKQALLIGIIDGDGYIFIDRNNKNPIISITCHKNWKTFYTDLYKELGFNPNYCSQTDTVLSVRLSRINEVKEIYNFTKNNNLIKLKRKWDKLEKLEKIK